MEFYNEDLNGRTIGHFQDVYTLVDKLKSKAEYANNKVYYRGQSEPWPPKASLHRKGVSMDSWQDTCAFINWLKDNNSISSEREVQRWGDNAYLAIAQHYGYKTDLIDFTTDLEVAAFFASDYNIELKSNNSKIGVIYCFTDDDISAMKKLFKSRIRKLEIADKDLEIFERNDYNPFFEFAFDGLSRIHNQSGIFLWDYKGFFSELYMGNYYDCSFVHTKKFPYKNIKINRNFIYPAPNPLEREVQRYIYPYRTRKAIDALTKTLQNSAIHFLGNPQEVNLELNRELDLLEWDDLEWHMNSPLFFPNHNSYISNEIKIDLESLNEVTKNKCLSYVNLYKQNINEGKLCVFIGQNKIIADMANEIIKTLAYYKYTNEQIATTLYYTLRILNGILKSQDNTTNRVSEWDMIPEISSQIKSESFRKVEGIMKSVYNGDIVELGLSDSFGVSTYAYVETAFLNKKEKPYRIKQESILKKYLNFDARKNLEHFGIVLMQYNTNPKKLFDFEDMCIIFSKYVLPSQFIFRTKEARIYIPSFLNSFGLA